MNTHSTRPRFSLFHEIDRGFSHLVNEVLQSESHGTLPVSVFELKDRYVIEADVPGVSEEGIELSLNDGVLEMSAERTKATPESAKTLLNERVFRRLERKVALKKPVETDSVDAELGNGVLRVTIQKSPAVVPRQIKIRKSEADS